MDDTARKPNVGIIDYGAGNFSSVWNAFERHDVNLVAVLTGNALENCTHLVLPGVGAFSSCMNKIKSRGLTEALLEWIEEEARPFLGICVGMQLLADKGSEFVETAGMGTVTGYVDRFDFEGLAPRPPLPHIGWNDVTAPSGSVLFQGLDPEDQTFYFVHSYHLRSADSRAAFATCHYGYEFPCAFEKGNVFGVQFHPEKSGRNGHQLIGNFLRTGKNS